MYVGQFLHMGYDVWGTRRGQGEVSLGYFLLPLITPEFFPGSPGRAATSPVVTVAGKLGSICTC